MNLSSELNKIIEWLKINKLSLNIKKCKFMIFHTPQKKISIPNIVIENIALESVEKFNCLGVILHQNMNWKSHIDSISSKIGKSIGVLNRLKHCLPISIKVFMYNSLILSRINYGILLWGYQCERILKLQKKALRIISSKKYNAHTEPIFKSLNLLKVSDIFSLCQLKFYYNLVHRKVPEYFYQLPFYANHEVHDHYTRQQQNLHICVAKHTFAKKCIRYSLPNLINETSSNIIDKVYTHSVNGFKQYVKKCMIQKYSDTCHIINCYICNQN